MLQTNVLGTHTLLECAKQYKIKRFIHVSTDEVRTQPTILKCLYLFTEVLTKLFCPHREGARPRPFPFRQGGVLISYYWWLRVGVWARFLRLRWWAGNRREPGERVLVGW